MPQYAYLRPPSPRFLCDIICECYLDKLYKESLTKTWLKWDVFNAPLNYGEIVSTSTSGNGNAIIKTLIVGKGWGLDGHSMFMTHDRHLPKMRNKKQKCLGRVWRRNSPRVHPHWPVCEQLRRSSGQDRRDCSGPQHTSPDSPQWPSRCRTVPPVGLQGFDQ